MENKEEKIKLNVEVPAGQASEVVKAAAPHSLFRSNLKQVIISIFIGACVAFFSSLFQGLADYLKGHAVEAVSALSTSLTYLAKTYKG